MINAAQETVSNFCWDLLQPKNSCYSQSHSKPNRGTNCVNSNNDPLVARRCANCDTTSTPLWRNGPSGPKSLCNACGIRFNKEERRASAARTTMASNVASSGGNVMEFNNQNSSWYSNFQNQKMRCFFLRQWAMSFILSMTVIAIQRTAYPSSLGGSTSLTDPSPNE